MGSTKPRFRADHPFVFFIRHIELGIILFAGRVSEPELAEPLVDHNRGDNKGSQKAYHQVVQPVNMQTQTQRQYTQTQDFKTQEQQYSEQQYTNQQSFEAQQARLRVQYPQIQPQPQRVQFSQPQPQQPQYSQTVQQPQRTQYVQNQNQYSQNTPSNQPTQDRYQNENDGFTFPKKN